MVPQKHREASKFIYNLGFFIETNGYPDFEEGRDEEAIKRRLKQFQTKTLKKKIILSLVIVLHIWIID